MRAAPALLLAALVMSTATMAEAKVMAVPQHEPVACSMEAKLCPDGTAVSRQGPNCEFAACPDGTATPPRHHVAPMPVNPRLHPHNGATPPAADDKSSPDATNGDGGSEGGDEGGDEGSSGGDPDEGGSDSDGSGE